MARPVQPPKPKGAPGEVQPEETGGSAAQGEDGYRCDICGAAMLEAHCKLRCPACGYTRDCSDP
jgi:rubrerythrin